MDTITFDDFAKVEMKMGEVIAAEVPEGSEKVVKLTVDFGPEMAGGPRTIFAGIKKWYDPVALKGKKLPFVLNIPEKKMGSLGVSQGMLVAIIAKDGDGLDRPVLLLPESEVASGSQLR